jgi:hypothetical protein
MTSEKQIQAKRINALKGGVKTRAGKEAVRLNAVTHGFFSNAVLLPGEDFHLMDEFRNKFMTELKPVGELETILVERVISSTWRLKRLMGTERKYTRRGGDYRYDSWQNCMRCEITLERQIFRSLRELEVRQKARLGKKYTQNSKLKMGSPRLNEKIKIVKSNPIRI